MRLLILRTRAQTAGNLLLQASRRDTRVDWLRVRDSFGFAVGDVLGVGFADGVGEGNFAAVGGLDGVVGHGPVFCVGDGAGGGGFYVEVVDLEVDQGGVGVSGNVERLFGSGGFD